MTENVKSIKGPVDVIVGGCCNQHIASNEVQHFFAESQVQDMHQHFNEIEAKELDYTHSRGAKCSNSIAATPSIRKHIEGSRFF